jgi:hypothetical protein
MFYQDGKDFCTRNFPSSYLKFLNSTRAEDWGGGGEQSSIFWQAANYLFHASLLLGLTFNTEDGVNISLKVSRDFQITWNYNPEHKILHNHPVRNINPKI